MLEALIFDVDGTLAELKALLPAAKVETAPALFARGSILRGIIADRTSPLAYGYEHAEVPVYFNQSPIINVGNLPPATLVDGPAGAPGRGGTITPMAFPLTLSGWDPAATGLAYGSLPVAPDAPAAAPAAAGACRPCRWGLLGAPRAPRHAAAQLARRSRPGAAARSGGRSRS